MKSKDIIRDYLRREETDSRERDAFERWIVENGTDPDVSSSLYEAFVRPEGPLPEEEQIAESFDHLLGSLGGTRQTFRKKYDRTRRLGILALVNGLVAVLALGFGFWAWSTRTPAAAPEPLADSAWTERYVPCGATDSLTLEDGTRLLLSAGTRITYPRHFDPRMQSREIFLDGEAFADVTRNPEIPFIIHSHCSTVTVRGTSFRYTNYQGEDGLSLMLESGAVEMEVGEAGQTRKMELVPGNSLHFNKRSGEVSILNIDLGLLSSRRGSLQFYDRSLQEIALALERKYGVRIFIESPQLADVRYYTFLSDAEDDPVRILRAMDSEGRMNIRRNHQNITISLR